MSSESEYSTTSLEEKSMLKYELFTTRTVKVEHLSIRTKCADLCSYFQSTLKLDVTGVFMVPPKMAFVSFGNDQDFDKVVDTNTKTRITLRLDARTLTAIDAAKPDSKKVADFPINFSSPKVRRKPLQQKSQNIPMKANLKAKTPTTPANRGIQNRTASTRKTPTIAKVVKKPVKTMTRGSNTEDDDIMTLSSSTDSPPPTYHTSPSNRGRPGRAQQIAVTVRSMTERSTQTLGTVKVNSPLSEYRKFAPPVTSSHLPVAIKWGGMMVSKQVQT